MDPDALAAAHGAEWRRLEELSRRRRPTAAETDELITRYRAASADLADLKASAGRTPHTDHLSLVLARARLRLTGVRPEPVAALTRFAEAQLPAALYRTRWTAAAVAAGFLVVAALAALWVAGDPAALAALGDRADLEQYAEAEFTGYYSANPAAVFAGTVWTNNAWIAAQCVLFGVTGVWPVYVLIQNAVGVGVSAAVMASFGRLDVFAGYILPHGMLELTCVFVAAAAGLQIFWSWVAPGPRGRADALAAAGRSLATVALGLAAALALSGAVEAWVTPAPWPAPVKIAVGALALALFLGYMLGLGRRAARAGEDGDADPYERGAERLVAG